MKLEEYQRLAEKALLLERLKSVIEIEIVLIAHEFDLTKE